MLRGERWEFSLDAFCRLAAALQVRFGSNDFRVCSAPGNQPEQCILRHDVDRWPNNARRMALLENQRGIRSTYYFRHRDLRRSGRVIRDISALGHEIGYHHEAMSRAQGNPVRAAQLFMEDLRALRTLVPRVTTAAMHGAPLSRVENAQFWRFHTLAEFGLEAEAFDIVNSADWVYLTDTGRSWSPGSANLRDHAPKASTLRFVRKTSQVIAALPEIEGNVCLVVHPERWNPAGLQYLMSWLVDLMAVAVKRVLRVVRRGTVEQ